MRLSQILEAQTTYPFLRLEERKRELLARGVELIDLGVGDPQEPTDPLIRRALIESVQETMGYPLSRGLPELREAIAGWCARRFGAELDPEREIVPTLGSKEAIFSFAQVLVDGRGGRDTVVTTHPGYPVAERGARFARANVLSLPLEEANGFLPAFDAIPETFWRRIAVFWVNYPNNPTGAVAPLELYERLAALAEEHEFVLASDEAYSELWFERPPPSALQVSQRANVAVFNSLSKRSSMTGYRSGFVVASPPLADALRKFRPAAGTAPQEFVQRASVAAWNDEAHVEQARERYRRKRDILLAGLAAAGLRVAASEATFYLWVATPDGEASEAFAERLLERGLVVAPGSYLGDAGEGYVRLALVPPEDACRRAAEILSDSKEDG